MRLTPGPAPSQVEKIDIGYAKKASQVDIKALKQDVWDLLVEGAAPTKAAKPAKPAATALGDAELSFDQALFKYE